MKKIFGILVVALAVTVATGMVLYQSGAPTASAQGKDRVQIDLIVSALNLPADGTKLSKKERPGTLESTLGIIRDALAKSDFQVDSFFDVMYVANIGSSGEDGVSFKSGANFDVFFEVEVNINLTSTFDTEMVCMSLSAVAPDPDNPQGALDAVKRAVEASKGRVYYGHVPVLK